MPNSLKLLLVAGARPNFMKIAPLIKAVGVHNANENGGRSISFRLVHTGQHYDKKMSDIFFEELGIPKPDVSLDVGSGSHAVQTARVMERFEPVCQEYCPDWVIVVGDVNSTVACALVATKLGVKVAHVEAGLRSFDRTMPEEINRIITDAMSDLLLTPSEDANDNLRREGIPEEKIRLVGNIMIDSLVDNLAETRNKTTLADVGVEVGKFAFATLHRPFNVDSEANLGGIMKDLNSLAQRMPVVFPVHPRTRQTLERSNLLPPDAGPFKIIDPVGYHDCLALTEHARLVVTDSGGLQEESTYFRTPCLTLRPNTERPITVTCGSNRLTSPESLAGDIEEVLLLEERLGIVPPLWDGEAAQRIVETLS